MVLFAFMTSSYHLLDTEQGRQRLVLLAINLTENTALAPQEQERGLLAQFVRGDLTIDQVLAHLDGREHGGDHLDAQA
jgi:hypothetical protein